jgi:5-methylcytosine-specific restriction endonuclease McrA
MRRNVTLDPATGRFVPTPRGERTEKMRQEETRLGVRFEDDYLEKMVNGDWGQKRFSKRWHVGNKSVIFGKPHDGRRSWTEILGLPPYRQQDGVPRERSNAKKCARCGAADVSSEKAHWIARRDGGPAHWWNLIDLCPTCHTRLDNDDKQVVRDIEEIVLAKAVRRLLEQKDERAIRKRLVDICTAIVTRQVPSPGVPVTESAESLT